MIVIFNFPACNSFGPIFSAFLIAHFLLTAPVLIGLSVINDPLSTSSVATVFGMNFGSMDFSLSAAGLPVSLSASWVSSTCVFVMSVTPVDRSKTWLELTIQNAVGTAAFMLTFEGLFLLSSYIQLSLFASPSTIPVLNV